MSEATPIVRHPGGGGDGAWRRVSSVADDVEVADPEAAPVPVDGPVRGLGGLSRRR